MMKTTSIVLAFLGMLIGFRAAWLWWQASGVPINPWIVPDELLSGNMAWTDAIKQAFNQSSRLNARAAAWTAAAVFISSNSAIAGAL